MGGIETMDTNFNENGIQLGNAIPAILESRPRP